MKTSILWTATLILISSYYTSFAQSYPGGVSSNLYLWVKAGAGITQNGSSQVTAWANQAATTMTTQASNATASANIVYTANSINYNPAVTFNSTSGYCLQGLYAVAPSSAPLMFAVSTPGLSAATTDVIGSVYSNSAEGSSGIFYDPFSGQSFSGHFAVDASGNVCSLSGSAVNGASSIVRVFYNNTSNTNAAYTAVNAISNTACGSNALSATDGNFQIGGRTWGGNTNRIFLGNIAEVVYLNANTATATQINQVESYLGIKYGITLGNTSNLVNYLASDGTTTFWTGNSTYQNDVFGIGRDNGTNGSALSQSPSNSMNLGSGNGTGQSAKGNLILTAVTALTNKQFLMIGDDQGALTEQSTNVPPNSPGAIRVTRTWLAQNTGSVGLVNLSFDKTGLTFSGGNTVSNYALVVNTSGTSNFATGTDVIYYANSISGNLINFNNISLPNNSIFTLVTFGGSVLPLTGIRFNANMMGTDAVLKWSLAGGDNAGQYEIEQSSDGIIYNILTIIPAKNNTGNINEEYEYVVYNVHDGLTFYRIKEIDIDGKVTYSQVRTIHYISSAQLVIESNPVNNGALNLSINNSATVAGIFSIINMYGQKLLQQTRTVQNGNTRIQMDISLLPAGTYLVYVQLGASFKTLKFIKL